MKEPLLDTDTLTYFLKGYPNVVSQVNGSFNKYGSLKISVITYYELLNGLLYKDAKKQMANFLELTQSSQILPITLEIAHLAAEIQSELRQKGRNIGHSDVLIGATALHHNLKVVTNNQAHFSQISNLEMENWV